MKKKLIVYCPGSSDLSNYSVLREVAVNHGRACGWDRFRHSSEGMEVVIQNECVVFWPDFTITGEYRSYVDHLIEGCGHDNVTVTGDLVVLSHLLKNPPVGESSKWVEWDTRRRIFIRDDGHVRINGEELSRDTFLKLVNDVEKLFNE